MLKIAWLEYVEALWEMYERGKVKSKLINSSLHHCKLAYNGYLWAYNLKL